MKLFLLVMTLFITAPHVMGQDDPKNESLLNKLFAPGPLIEGHHDLEKKDCLKCHEAGKGISQEKCLECHKEIRPFLEKKLGFHGLAKKTCIECHSDHKGRDFDSTLIDEKKFDHDLTGYKLEGKHHDIKCAECHKTKRNKKPIRPKDTHYLGAATTCVSCHKKDDVHYFKNDWAKKDCNACHGLGSWKKDIKFDHEKDGKYKIEGKHTELKCAECHVPKKRSALAKYKWPNLKKSECLTCHENIHVGKLSSKYQNGKCTTCHTQNEWKIKKFDHKITRYPLRGEHAEIDCTKCHRQSKGISTKDTKQYRWLGLKSDCLSCHADFHAFDKHRAHKYKNLNQCLECHNESKWKEIHNFDHDKDTKYIIDGKHSTLKCSECHTPTRTKIVDKQKFALARLYHWPDLDKKTCETCHKSPHKKTFYAEFQKRKCNVCHVTTGWLDQPGKAGNRFTHDETRFKLTGEHTKTACRECHEVNKKQVFKFKSFEKEFCIDCHKSPHAEQFHEKYKEQACSECHTTKDFKKLLTFDHATTAFPLRGQHKELKCIECHTPLEPQPQKSKVVWHKFIFKDVNSKGCISCHKDYHAGQLSLKCQTCHNEESWKKNIKFDHDIDSKFELKGKHADLKCKECHKVIPDKTVEFANQKYKVVLYRPMAETCVSCHQKDDKHKGTFGGQCQTCHNDRDWKLTKDFHKNFSLHGVHYTATCTECHINDRRLGGMSENCVLCHQKDDIHSGTLPNCTDCHDQHFWETTSFRHSMTLFPLRGSHRALDCFACHTNGTYQGTPSDCINCHLRDAQSVVTPIHTIPAFQDCKGCHNQFTFQR